MLLCPSWLGSRNRPSAGEWLPSGPAKEVPMLRPRVKPAKRYVPSHVIVDGVPAQDPTRKSPVRPPLRAGVLAPHRVWL